MYDLTELSNKTLCCFCDPEPCHGQILLDLYRLMVSQGTMNVACPASIKKAKKSKTDEKTTLDMDNEDLRTEIEKSRAELKTQKKPRYVSKKKKDYKATESIHNIFTHFPKDPN